jgi:Tol biopolymer transport system component
MICPHCRQEHPDGALFCPITGQKIRPASIHCPSCNRPISQGIRFCPYCGRTIAAPVPPGFSPPGARRKGLLSSRFGLLAGGLLVLSVAVFAVYWFYNLQLSKTNKITTVQALFTPTPQPGAKSEQTQESLALSVAITLDSNALQGTPSITDTAPPLPTDTPRPTETPILLPTYTPWLTSTSSLPNQGTATAEVALTQAAEERLVTPTAYSMVEAGLIAFNSNRSGNNDIYVMYSDGSQVTRITNSPYDERVPSWSPDGRFIAYQSNEGGDYELMVYDLETGRTSQVTNNSCDDFNPVWSPDGAWLAFYSDCDGNREIYTMRSNGSDRRQLTHTSGIYNWFPNWSPDGRHITFSSNRSGKYEVYIMNADGSGVRTLGRGCVSAFSPDGENLVFAQYCTDTGQIYIIGTDGSNLRTLVEEENNANPSWAPDGERVLFQSERSGNEEIYVINIDGSELTQLTFDPGRDSAPVWQSVPIPIR